MPPTTIRETQEKLKLKEVSCLELTEEYLERIEKFDPGLNSFVTVTKSIALHKAREMDTLLKESGEDVFKTHPLLGAVYSLKDMYLTRGIRSTAASKVLENYIPAYSSTVYTRLDNAGAILVGKNNCDAWAHGASGENSDFGPTKNPWDLDYVPGGSSSGAAVAVASDFALFSMGTDTGGSIRLPASFTGTVGLKPTYGSVSRYGVISMASSLDSMGHFTNNVEDSKAIFNVTKGPDGKDATVGKGEYKKSNKKLRIGIPKEYFVEGMSREVESVVEEAIKVFKKKDVEIVDVTLPHTKYANSVYYIVQPAEVSSNLSRYDGIRYGEDRDKFGDEAKRRIMLGSYVLSSGYYDAYYLKAMKVRSLLIQDFEKAFEDVDAILAPVSPTPPFKLGEKSDDPLAMYLADVFTISANLVGIPGLAIPGGFTESGLPVGFQLMGPRFSEDMLFDLGSLYQDDTDWHIKKPSLIK